MSRTSETAPIATRESQSVSTDLPPRRLVVMMVTASIAPADVLARLPGVDPVDAAWVGVEPPPGFTALPLARAAHALGREFGAVVFDARAGFDADALGAVSGTIRAGGSLVLLAPPLDDWPAFDDPDYTRIAVSGTPRSAIRGRFLRRVPRVDPVRRAGAL